MRRVNWDFFLAAVFLWIIPFAAALSNLEIIVEKKSCASFVFLAETKERNFFIEFFSSVFNFILCRRFVLSTRNLFNAVLLCGNFNAPFLVQIYQRT
jgi:hypothetical protein